jgi:hypothetical protein
MVVPIPPQATPIPYPLTTIPEAPHPLTPSHHSTSPSGQPPTPPPAQCLPSTLATAADHTPRSRTLSLQSGACGAHPFTPVGSTGVIEHHVPELCLYSSIPSATPKPCRVCAVVSLFRPKSVPLPATSSLHVGRHFSVVKPHLPRTASLYCASTSPMAAAPPDVIPPS